jgi:hypothetical protein
LPVVSRKRLLTTGGWQLATGYWQLATNRYNPRYGDVRKLVLGAIKTGGVVGRDRRRVDAAVVDCGFAVHALARIDGQKGIAERRRFAHNTVRLNSHIFYAVRD